MVVPALGQTPPAEERDDIPVHIVEAPDTPVGRQLRWVMRVVNGEEAIGDLSKRFSTRFIEEFKAKEITETILGLRETVFGGRQVDLVQIHEEETNEHALNGIVNGRESNRFLSVFIALDEKTGLISGLLFNRAGYSCGAGDWDTYGGEFGRLSGAVSFGCYELVPDPEAQPPATEKGPFRLKPVYEIKERDLLSIGQGFRLWVLGALGERVAAGKAAWTDELGVKDEWKAVPFGETAKLSPGATLPLAEFARRMVVGNDSTATDHLVLKLGRDVVSAWASKRVRYPGEPLLTTREFLFLKLNPDPDVMLRFAENDAEMRRELLKEDKISTGTPNWEGLELWSDVREIKRVGWFASVKEQCGVLAELERVRLSEGMAPLAEAMKRESDVPLDPDVWTLHAYVAGSEPGVQSYAWMLTRADGRRYVMAVTWNDVKGGLDENRLLDLSRAGLEILAKHEVGGRDGETKGEGEVP